MHGKFNTAMATNTASILLFPALIAAFGCTANSPDVAGTQASPQASLASEKNQWVTSSDWELALRFSVGETTVAADASIYVVAQLRNESQRELVVLRPFGDRYAASSVGLRMWGPNRPIDYSGPTEEYTLGTGAFVVLAPNQVVEDEMDIPVLNRAGSNQPGEYTIRYEYSYDGSWDQVSERGGFATPWRGWICSRELRIRKVQHVGS